MSLKVFVSFACLLNTLLVLVKSEVIIESGQVPLDRCTDTRSTNQYFACKLDDCDQWISFTKCPENTVSTAAMNMAQKCLICKNYSDAANKYEAQGLVPKSMCSLNFTQEDVLWCHYEHCWFPFTGCDENETETGYLNFNLMAVHCGPKETASTSASTPNPANYTSYIQTAYQHSGQLSIHWNIIILLYLSICISVVLS